MVKDLEKFLRAKIPLTKALEVKILSATARSVELQAPLKPNHNHMGSAFGGSLSALLILGGYTWLYHCLKEAGLDGHVILKGAETDYLHPVEEDIHVICEAPSEKEREKFLATYRRKGLSRIFLDSEIRLSDGTVAATFHGEFVARVS